jgi:hypothetical protein
MKSLLSIMGAVTSPTLSNVGAALSGLLVGTLLIFFFDPVAKTLIWRGIKGAWKRQSKF